MSKTVPWSACEESGLLNLDERRVGLHVLDLLRLARPLTGLSSCCVDGGIGIGTVAGVSGVLRGGSAGWESSDGGGGRSWATGGADMEVACREGAELEGSASTSF
jgi:hypothetical protein